MDEADKDKKDDKVRGLLEAGAELAGGTAAAGIGALIGGVVAGPPGAVIGGGIGTAAVIALRRAGEEISERLLGPREKVRAGAVMAIAAAEIESRTKAGQKLREDGFFEPGSTGRSSADEVAEGVLLKAQREPEEKKIPFMGHLLAGIAFDATVNPELAHQLTKAAEQLTYRQLCILNLAANKDKHTLRRVNYRGQTAFEMDLLQVLYECHDLYTRGFVDNGPSVAFGPSDMAPGEMTTQGLGGFLYNLMRLANIPGADVERVAQHLA